MVSTRSCGRLARRRGPINCNIFAAYTMTSTWRQINGQATPYTTTIAIFLLIAYPIDRCKCFISANLAVNKQEGEVKTYMFVRERSAKISTSTQRNHKSSSSDHKKNKSTTSNHKPVNRPRTTAILQQYGTKSSLEQGKSIERQA